MRAENSEDERANGNDSRESGFGTTKRGQCPSEARPLGESNQYERRDSKKPPSGGVQGHALPSPGKTPGRITEARAYGPLSRTHAGAISSRIIRASWPVTWSRTFGKLKTPPDFWP